MDFYGDLTDADFEGDLLVQAAGHDQCHHLPLTRGQGLKARFQFGEYLLVLQPRAIARQAQLDRVQQVLIAEWLGQEFDRASLYRPDRHRDVAVPGDEYDRNMNVGRRELPLKIETASAGQPDIEHKAGRPFRAPIFHKFRYRGQRLDLQAHGTQQTFERLADPRVVINDDNGRFRTHRSR